jgi:hypothetical protein
MYLPQRVPVVDRSLVDGQPWGREWRSEGTEALLDALYE